MYIYPHLPSIKTFPFIRYAGSGLCNSLFVYCRALLLSRDYNLQLINPTWLNFDPVQWKIGAKDKRTYKGIFKPIGITGLKKIFILMTHNKIKEEEYLKNCNMVDNKRYVKVFYMKGFEPLMKDVSFVNESLKASIKKRWLETVDNFDFYHKIAVHIRFGDYAENKRQGIEWYCRIVQQIHNKMPDYTFLLFTDAKDNEINSITALPYVKKIYFGSSISDLFAISSCCALVGSHSTFSDWGGFLGQIPSILPKPPQYGSFLTEKEKEFILDDKALVPENFYYFLQGNAE